MDKQFEVEFRKGGKFTAALLVDEAPKTCEAFLKALPIEGRFRQARFSGEEFYIQAPIDCDPENQKTPQRGDIAFNADPKWRAVCLYYGDHLRVKTPFNLFARIVSGNLEELRKVGERVWLEGQEPARVRLVS